jgi:hypothetical protein
MGSLVFPLQARSAAALLLVGASLSCHNLPTSNPHRPQPSPSINASEAAESRSIASFTLADGEGPFVAKGTWVRVRIEGTYDLWTCSACEPSLWARTVGPLGVAYYYQAYAYPMTWGPQIRLAVAPEGAPDYALYWNSAMWQSNGDYGVQFLRNHNSNDTIAANEPVRIAVPDDPNGGYILAYGQQATEGVDSVRASGYLRRLRFFGEPEKICGWAGSLCFFADPAEVGRLKFTVTRFNPAWLEVDRTELAAATAVTFTGGTDGHATRVEWRYAAADTAATPLASPRNPVQVSECTGQLVCSYTPAASGRMRMYIDVREVADVQGYRTFREVVSGVIRVGTSPLTCTPNPLERGATVSCTLSGGTLSDPVEWRFVEQSGEGPRHPHGPEQRVAGYDGRVRHRLSHTRARNRPRGQR